LNASKVQFVFFTDARRNYMKIIITLIAAFTLATLAQGADLKFFVAPNGSDSNPGTKRKPFQTLAKARDAVRVAIPRASGDIVVTIAEGIYPITNTVVFGPEDAATGSNRIIYRAAPGAKPVFTGGISVTGWQPYRDGIWQAPLHRDHKLRALYVNGQRAFMTSSGKINAQGGWGTYTVTAGQAPWAWQSGSAADGVRYNRSDLPEIVRNPTDVEIENQTTWNANFVSVREIITEGNQYIFKLQQPYGAIAQQIGWGAGLTLGSQHIIHNAFELLKQPGQFYFDRDAQTVYYLPRPGEDMQTAKVMAPVTETLIKLEGQPLKQRVRNLTFEGLTFDCTDYNLLDVAGSHGVATLQTACVYTAFANPNWHLDVYRAFDVLPGAIEADAIEGVEFIRNTVSHTGCEGIVLCNDISDSRVVGNVIRDTGGSAISLGHPQHVYENDTPDLKNPAGAGIEHEKFPAGTEAAPRRVLISNNFLPDDALLFPGHTIITVFFANSVTVEHNWIPSSPYSGINFGWGWCDFDGSPVAVNPAWGFGQRPSVIPGKPTTVAGNNRIHANRVENTVSILHDAGGIYLLGNQPGTVMDRNYVRRSEKALYTDEGSAGIYTHDNVVQSPYFMAHWADNFGRKHNITIDHYFVTENKFTVAAPGCTLSNTVLCQAGHWPPEAQAIIDESGLEPAWRSIVPADWKQVPADWEGVDMAWVGNAIDFVLPGTDSDGTHLTLQRNSNSGPAMGRTYRDGEEFAYRVKVPAGKPSLLKVTYWGEEAQERKFDIYLNDHLVATQELFHAHPGQFFDQDYAIQPEWLPSGTNGGTVDVVIRFAVEPGGFTAGGIYGLRILPVN
jgi:hypothetical protein